MISNRLTQIAAALLVPALVIDPTSASSLAQTSRYAYPSLVSVVPSRMMEQALEARELHFLASQAISEKSQALKIESQPVHPTGISRRHATLLWTRLSAGLGLSSVFARFGFAQGQVESRLQEHLRQVWRWIYQDISPRTYLAYSHPDDGRITRWAVVYDQAMRIMGHIQTGDIDMARRSMDYFLNNQAIRKLGGWIVNAVDANSADGIMLEPTAHSGPNAYLGMAALQLYLVTKDIRYLNFARERWELIKSLQVEDARDPNYGGIRMGPKGDPTSPGDQRLDQNPKNPSFYNFFNAEHAVDFKALSDLLYAVDTSHPEKQRYQRASDLISIWDKTIFDEDTNLFYWGSTEVPFFDDPFGIMRSAGVVKTHPLDATALKLAAYGPDGLDTLFGASRGELIRKAVDDNFKVTVTYTSPEDGPVTVTGYDFVTNNERRQLVVRKSNARPVIGRGPLLWDEGSTWVAFSDLSFQAYYIQQRNQDRANAYRAFYEENARNQALRTAVHLRTGWAYPYAHPIPASYREPVGWGWLTPLNGYSLIGGVARSLGMLASDPFKLRFGPFAQSFAAEKNAPLASRNTAISSGEILTNIVQYIDAGWALINQEKWAEAAQRIEAMTAEHPDWADEAKRKEKEVANSRTPFPSLLPDRSNLGTIFAQYGSLYYMGAAEWIRFIGYARQGKRPEALKSAVAILRDFPHAQVYDGSRGGFFWRPTEALQDQFPDYYRQARQALGGRAMLEIPGKTNQLSRRKIFKKIFPSAIVGVLIAFLLGHPQQVAAEPIQRTSSVLLSSIGYSFEQLPPQTLIIAALLVVVAIMSFMLGVRYARGHRRETHADDAPWLSRWIHRFAAEPGSFYKAIIASTILTELVNAFIFITAPNTPDPTQTFFRQAFLLSIGVIFVMRILHYAFSTLWMALVKPAPAPQSYAISDRDLPILTVQIPIRAEPFEVVRRTLDSALALDYPKEKIEIQIIDNSDRPEQYREIKAYAEAHGAVFIHRDGTRGFKAGNLKIGLEKSHGEFILVLDSDSWVSPRTLLQALPEFKDSKLGYVQLRISTINKNDNAITKVIDIGMRANQQVLQISSDQGLLKFDGHNAIIRRTALEAVGGWAEEVSEDLATSINIRLAGWGSKYLPYAETGEDAPASFQEFMKQRRKWAFGTTEIFFKYAIPILKSPHLKWYEKADILFQMSGYLTASLGFLLVFAYIQFPVVGAIIILGSPFLPLLIANPDRRKEVLKEFGTTLLVFSALLPTLFIGTVSYLVGRKEGFRVTFKGKDERLSLKRLLRLNIFGIVSGLTFFAILPNVYPDIPAYLEQYPPSVIAMSIAIGGPLIMNYSRAFQPGISGKWVAAISPFRKVIILALLLAFIPKIGGESPYLWGSGWLQTFPVLGFILAGLLLIYSKLPEFHELLRLNSSRGKSYARLTAVVIALASLFSTSNLFSHPAPAPWTKTVHILDAPTMIDLGSAHYGEYVDFSKQEKAAFWDFRSPISLRKGQRIQIHYELARSNVMGVQLKPIEELDSERGDMVVVPNASNGHILTIVVPSDRKVRRIAFQLGPRAYGYLGGTMAAKLKTQAIEIVNLGLAFAPINQNSDKAMIQWPAAGSTVATGAFIRIIFHRATLPTRARRTSLRTAA